MKFFLTENILSFFKMLFFKNTLFLIALLIVSVVIFVPLSPMMPWEGLDNSWIYGMNQALAQGLSFGKEIIFTFGPYASIYTRNYHPNTDQLMIWGSLFFALSLAIALYLNFRLTGWFFKLALLTVLSAVMYSRDALFFFYPMLVGVQVYHFTISLDAQKGLDISKIALIVALFAPFGLLPLIKGSALIACVAISVLSIALLAKRKEWKLCLLIGAIPLLSLVIFWLLSGQPLQLLANYFIGLIPIVSGYTEAMAVNGDPREYILYAVASATLIVILILETQGSTFDKSIVVLMFLCLLFLAFKAGFVRHDGHAIISGTMILLGALLASTLFTTQGSLIVFFACFIAWGYVDAKHVSTSTSSIAVNIIKTYVSAWSGLKQRIYDPEALTRRFTVRVAELNQHGAIPRLNGSVDIYSYDQSKLIASGNKWNPRPVLQSYSVYTAKLAELNKLHLLSESRPDNIVFKVQPIDGRLPSLEDGASWPVLLSNYVPNSFSNDYLLLKNRASSHLYEEPRKIGGGVYSLGEQINLPKADAPLFVKVEIRKSFLGNIVNTLFKPSQLFIKLTMQNGVIKNYRIIAGMSKSGFVISPLIENTEELGLLFSGSHYLNDKVVKSIEIFAPRFSFLWKSFFEISFYQLNFRSSSGFIEKMNVVAPRAEDIVKVTSVQRCDGVVDSINGVSPAPNSISATSLLTIHGWLVASLELSEVPDKVYLVLSNTEGKRYFIDAMRTQRPDVGAYFKKPSLSLSGYAAIANVTNLAGQYHLGLAYLKDNEIHVCPQFNILVKLN